MQPKTIAILGCGQRGQTFARLIKDLSHLGKVVAIAEPREQPRRELAEAHTIASDHVFNSYQEFCAKPKLADAVVIATMDRDHAIPAVICLDKGYDLLLEKPMAVSLEDCQRIEAAQRRNNRIMVVCHSMRYHKGHVTLRDVVHSGVLGRVMTIEHLEEVGIYHQAHSFVRGNWGNEGRATFMLLAKSCHDMDYLTFLIRKPCLAVSSFGSLSYFRRENAPDGSTDFCADGCKVEHSCPYSALKHYVIPADGSYWWANIATDEKTVEARLAAIRHSPYGRCVWRCDNDVVDHQVVALQFADDITATFTMTAFGLRTARRTHVRGTLGQAVHEGDSITIRTYADRNTQTVSIAPETGTHGGGDGRVVHQWLSALHSRDTSQLPSTAQESLQSHAIAFAAERSRHEGRTVKMSEILPA